MYKLSRLKVKRKEFGSVFVNEFQHIFKDAGVVLIMIFAILIYSTLYSLAYRNQVLRDIPVAVIDNSNSPSSRQLIRIFDAAPNIQVSYNPAGMEEAKELFMARKINGIVYIPDDYENNLLKGIPAIAGVYVDASYFLMYRQVFSDVVAGLTGTGTEVEFSRLLAAGVSAPQAKTIVDPVSFQVKNLYNPFLGYGNFIMPAIIIVIIQQTLLIGIGMIGGTWREFGTYRKLCVPGERRLSTVPIVLGKAAVYGCIYTVTMIYVLWIHYRMFGFPMNGAFGDIVLFLIPYLLSCIFLGIAISTLFQYRENSILFLLWTSIPIILLSGASMPKEAIPTWLYNIGKIFPSSSGVEGFHRIQTMGANLHEVAPEFTTLWILTGIYFVLAAVGIRLVMNKPDVKYGNPSDDCECIGEKEG